MSATPRRRPPDQLDVERFACRANITRFEHELAKQPDPPRRTLLEDLLRAERRRLAELD